MASCYNLLDELLKGNVNMTIDNKEKIIKLLCVLSTKIWLWKLDSEQESNEKNQCFQTVVLSEDV